MSRVVHGGIHDDELRRIGIDPAGVIDLSANLHPVGPHPAVVEAWRAADVTRYPDPAARPLRSAIATAADLDPAQVLVTPGANAALYLAAQALLGPGQRAVVCPPTYGEYEAAIAAAGAVAVPWEAVFQPDPPRFQREGATPVSMLAYLCNPNNPTGEYLSRPAVEAIVDSMAGSTDGAGLGTEPRTLVLDVAYDPFVATGEWWDANALVRDGRSVLVVHSLTKLHGIPGLRVGYVTGPAPLIARIEARQPAWAIGAPEQAAALAALTVDAEQRAAVAGVGPLRRRLADRLRADGWTVVEGRANFLIVEAIARDGRGGGRLRAALLRRGYAVRNCASLGLPAWARLAVPDEREIEPLTRAMAEARGELMRDGRP